MCVIQNLGNSNLSEKGLILAYSLRRAQSLMGRKPWLLLVTLYPVKQEPEAASHIQGQRHRENK